MRTFVASLRYDRHWKHAHSLGRSVADVLQVAKLFADSSCIALTSFISPYRADRKIARDLHAMTSQSGDEPLPFIEVYIEIPVEVAEQRDPKGLYKKARAGEIKDFTGISAPYEEPEHAEIRIRSDKLSPEESVVVITRYLQEKGLIPAQGLDIQKST